MLMVTDGSSKSSYLEIDWDSMLSSSKDGAMSSYSMMNFVELYGLWVMIQKSFVPDLVAIGHNFCLFLITLPIWVWALVLLPIVLRAYYVYYVKPLPPGPWGLPLVGMILTHGAPFQYALRKLANRYGGIVSFKMGLKTVVSLTDPILIRRAFSKTEFGMRPRGPLYDVIGGYGIISSDGPSWAAHRRFLHRQKFGLQAFFDDGFKIENRVEREAHTCMEVTRLYKGQAIDPAKIFNFAVANVIIKGVISKGFRHDGPIFSDIMSRIDDGFKIFSTAGILAFVDIADRVPMVSRSVRMISDNRAYMMDVMMRILEKREETLDIDNQKDLLDNYLAALRFHKAIQRGEAVFPSTGEEGKLTKDDFKVVVYDPALFDCKDPKQQIVQIIIDLFSAGVETVKTNMVWAILRIINHPDKMYHVRRELDAVVGPRRMPTAEDLPHLPFTCATILEILRISNVVPFGTTHTVTKDTEFAGYRIPKGAHVMPNLFGLNMCSRFWALPDEFLPERFLEFRHYDTDYEVTEREPVNDSEEEHKTDFDEEVDITPGVGPYSHYKVTKPKHFMPFSSGQRMCMGDKLAELELCLFFASLVHTNHIELEGDKMPDMRGNLGATITPDDFMVRFVGRNFRALRNQMKSPSLAGVRDLVDRGITPFE